jgi:hypothetical protein
MNDSLSLNEDLLRGASQIADFICGDPKETRRIYHLVDTQQFPHFRIGNTICARKSTLLTWISEQERAAIKQAPTAA